MKGRCPRPLDERVETHGARVTLKKIDRAKEELILEDTRRVRQAAAEQPFSLMSDVILEYDGDPHSDRIEASTRERKRNPFS